MSEAPRIEINVTGATRVGATSLAWLLSDFLQHTGFEVEINSDDLDDHFMANHFHTIPDRLESIIERGTVVVVNDRTPKALP